MAGMPSYDVVVAGLGGFGSATAAHLARRGVRVLGLDPRPGAHAEGSSHGETRIVRQVYFEGAAYVPLLRRAYELWAELADPGGPLLQITGGLFLGGADTKVFRGSLDTARHWDLDHEVLDATEVHARFPALNPPPEVLGLYESQAGTVPPERAVAAQLRRAAQAGAELRHDEAVVGWSVRGDGVRVRSTRSTYDGGVLVLAPGKWAPELVRLALPLTVEPRVQHWFAPPDIADFRPDRLPVWIWDRADGTSFYGAPSQDGESVKAAVHFSVDPDPGWAADRLAGTLAELFPTLGSRQVRQAECWYTLTPDHHFVVGAHPESPRVLLACGFSGHGFKFTPVLGEALGDLAVDGSTPFDLSTFDPLRFG
jgi:monomeric sarcosine oxidase